MKMHVGVSSQPAILFGLVAGKIIQNHMNFFIKMSGQDSVQELEEFPAPPASVVAGLNLAAGNVESGKEGGGAMTFVLMIKAGQGLAIGQFGSNLGPVPRLEWLVFRRWPTGAHSGED